MSGSVRRCPPAPRVGVPRVSLTSPGSRRPQAEATDVADEGGPAASRLMELGRAPGELAVGHQRTGGIRRINSTTMVRHLVRQPVTIVIRQEHAADLGPAMMKRLPAIMWGSMEAPCQANRMATAGGAPVDQRVMQAPASQCRRSRREPPVRGRRVPSRIAISGRRQRLQDAALRHCAVSALADEILKLAPEGLEISYLALNLLQVFAGNPVDGLACLVAVV